MAYIEVSKQMYRNNIKSTSTTANPALPGRRIIQPYHLTLGAIKDRQRVAEQVTSYLLL